MSKLSIVGLSNDQRFAFHIVVKGVPALIEVKMAPKGA
jgi:hypothetical protein